MTTCVVSGCKFHIESLYLTKPFSITTNTLECSFVTVSMYSNKPLHAQHSSFHLSSILPIVCNQSTFLFVQKEIEVNGKITIYLVKTILHLLIWKKQNIILINIKMKLMKIWNNQKCS